MGCHYHDNATNAITSRSVTFFNEREKWHHITVTLEDGVAITSYCDGIKIDTSAAVTGGHLNGTFWIGETNNIEGAINDVRIYDHVLSYKEVSELAKGLILHYPLKDPYIESTNNICTVEKAPIGTNNTWGGHTYTTTNYNASNDPVPFNTGSQMVINYSGSGNGGASRSI